MSPQAAACNGEGGLRRGVGAEPAIMDALRRARETLGRDDTPNRQG